MGITCISANQKTRKETNYDYQEKDLQPRCACDSNSGCQRAFDNDRRGARTNARIQQ